MPVNKDLIAQDELSAIIDRAQDLAADASRLVRYIERGAKADPAHAVRSSMSILTASLTLADLGRVLLLAPGLEETQREILAEHAKG